MRRHITTIFVESFACASDSIISQTLVSKLDAVFFRRSTEYYLGDIVDAAAVANTHGMPKTLKKGINFLKKCIEQKAMMAAHSCAGPLQKAP